jgi:hypothetical protein
MSVIFIRKPHGLITELYDLVLKVLILTAVIFVVGSFV